jgi:hypothetical protein
MLPEELVGSLPAFATVPNPENNELIMRRIVNIADDVAR